ncbi:MAG: ABC transporter substrate-binding protein [Anaerolineae bacterium]|nr:ABC transporter substrate-binding protein [Anaerolineae bacterium]
MKSKVMLIIVLALLLALVGTSAAQSTTVLRVASTAGVTTWDPALSFSTEALYMANIYETLVRVNAPGADSEISPVLATDWSSSEDGLTWTFNLREGVLFHDGAPLTADAVKRSIDRAKAISGASFIWLPLESIDVVDDLTVQFNLSYPAPLPLILGSTYAAWIVSPTALDAVDADETYFEAGVAAGTGPYMLADYTPDAEVVLAQHPDYWGGWSDGQFENILISIVADAVTQEQLLRGGEVDLALRMPPSSYQSFVDDEAYNVATETTLFNYVGFLNVLRAPLDNQAFRQALSYSVPYEDMIAVAVEGLGTQARGPVPDGVFPFSEDVPQYSFDPDVAQRLLEESGVDPSTVTLRMTYAAENTIEESMAPLLKDAWEETLGITVEVEAILFGQQWQEAKADPAAAQDIFLLLYWPTYSDAGSDNLLSMFRSSEAPFFNLSYWANETFDTLVDDAIVISGTDPDAAQAMYTEAMTLLVEDAPGLFFMDVGTWYAVPTYLDGFAYNLNYPFSIDFYAITLAQ